MIRSWRRPNAPFGNWTTFRKEARGENVFVIQGEQGDPEYRRAVMKTQAAIDAPVEQSLAQLQALNEVAQRRSQAQAQEREEPMRQAQAPMQIG